MLDDRSIAFLKRLLDAPGPSGFEQVPARLWREEAKAFAAVDVDVAGNSMATLNPSGSPRVMLTGHVDEIGVMVVHVDDDGFVHFGAIGGWDSQVLVGQRVVLGGRGGPVPGVVGKKPIHLIKTEEKDKASKITDLWIDIGAANKKEAEERVRVGDAGVIACSALELPNGRIASRSIDNRIGAFVVLEALRRLATEPPRACAVAVGTTQEEIGTTGGGARTSAFHLEPAGGHRGGRHARHGLPRGREEGTGGLQAGRRPGAVPRLGGEPGGLRPARRGGRSGGHPLRDRGRPAVHFHRRRPDLHVPAGHRDGAGLRAVPLHAQPERDGVVRRPGPRGGAARRLGEAARAVHVLHPGMTPTSTLRSRNG